MRYLLIAEVDDEHLEDDSVEYIARLVNNAIRNAERGSAPIHDTLILQSLNVSPASEHLAC